jgi:hypothetical protein
MMGDRWSGAELDRLGRAVLEAAPDAIILADREGVIRFWNRGPSGCSASPPRRRSAAPSTPSSRSRSGRGTGPGSTG